MRLAPTIGRPVTRSVPVGGVFLPEGTTVGVHPWALHRDLAVFDSPDDFVPEWWLHDGSEEGEIALSRSVAC